MLKRLPFAVVLILLVAANARAQGMSSNIREKDFPNGLKAIIMEDHKAPLVTFQVWYRVGSRDEQAGTAGMSHLLEHMMFKGTKRLGPSEFSKIVQKNGGMDNAFTTKDCTVYFEDISSDRLPIVMRMEADRMQNLRLDPEEMLSERDVVMEERRMRTDDDPQNALYEEVIATAFKASSYHWPVIGWMNSIKNITPEMLRSYYKSFYSPDNAVVIIAGDVKPDAGFNLVQKYFGAIKPRPMPKVYVAAEPPQTGEKRVYLKKEAQLPYLLTAYHVPNALSPDSYALEGLASVLSGGKSARLYTSLVYRKQVALSAFAEYDRLSKGPFAFYAGGTPAAGHTAEELEAGLNKEIEKIKKAPPTDFELQKAKNQIEAEYTMGQDSLFYEAETAGMYEMLGDWRLKDKFIENVRKVTAADVSRVARKYLTKDNSTVGILVPLKGKTEEKPPVAPGEGHVR